ncbi:MAG: hypothetical protein U0930_05950 [Pirellulales bacterium]
MRITKFICTFIALCVFSASASAQTGKPTQSGASITGKPAGSKAGTDAHNHDAHDHDAHGPHDGELLVVGKEEFHLELCVDEAKKQVIIYILDKSAKTAVAIDQPQLTINLKLNNKPTQIKLKAMPQQSDKSGTASCFGLVSADLLNGLHDEKSDARMVLKIGTKQYSVKVVHNHDHSGHDHAGHDHSNHNHATSSGGQTKTKR